MNNVLRELLECNIFYETVDDDDNTLLHLVLNGSVDYELDLVKLLLEKGLDVNAKNKFEYSPLQFAVSNLDCNVDVVKVLLDRGASIHHRDNFGNSVLHHVLKQSDCNIIKLLLDKGADVNSVNNDGDSPLNLVVIFSTSWIRLAKQENDETKLLARKRQRAIEDCKKNEMARRLDILKLLLGCDPDVNLKNNFGDSPLSYAVYECLQKQDLILLLLRSGADINLNNNCGDAPLHHAIHCDFEVIELLLDYGADINASNNYGESPLCLAVKNPICLRDTLKLLLDRGADVLACNQSGDMPLLKAIQDFDRDETTVDRVKLLIKYTLATSLGFNLNALIKHTKHFQLLSKFATECTLELMAMGLKKVAHMKYPEFQRPVVVTLYEFMCGYQVLPPFFDSQGRMWWNEKKVAQSNINDVLGILMGKKFPLYNEVISAKVKRKDMINKLMKQLIFTVREDNMIFLDFYSVCGIAKYLSNNDLLNWIMAYHGTFQPCFLISGISLRKKHLGKRGGQEIEGCFKRYKKTKHNIDVALNLDKKSKILIE